MRDVLVDQDVIRFMSGSIPEPFSSELTPPF